MKNDIAVDYIKDNYFTELKEMEILRERIATLDTVNNYVGQYFSQEWVMKNVLQFTDDDIAQVAQQSSDESGDEQQNDEEQ